jgi:hypothetical protein
MLRNGDIACNPFICIYLCVEVFVIRKEVCIVRVADSRTSDSQGLQMLKLVIRLHPAYVRLQFWRGFATVQFVLQSVLSRKNAVPIGVQETGMPKKTGRESCFTGESAKMGLCPRGYWTGGRANRRR